MSFGPAEITVTLAVLGIVLVVFGPKKLPALGKGIGEFCKNLKHGFREVRKDVKKIENDFKT